MEGEYSVAHCAHFANYFTAKLTTFIRNWIRIIRTEPGGVGGNWLVLFYVTAFSWFNPSMWRRSLAKCSQYHVVLALDPCPSGWIKESRAGLCGWLQPKINACMNLE